MKLAKIIIFSLAALVVLAIVAAVIIVNTVDVNKFKPQIIAQANSALNGRFLDFKRARLGLSPIRGVSVRIEGVTVTEDPAFGPGNFLSIDSASLGVNVLGYLVRRQISISSISIDSLRMTVIRQKDGTINAQTIAKTTAPASGQQRAAPAAAMPALLISSLKVNNSSVKFIDNSFSPPLSLDVADIDIAVSAFSLTSPFSFRVDAAVLSKEQNIAVSGKAQLDLASNSVTISGLSASTDLSRLLLASVPSALPMLKGAPLPVQLQGKAEVGVDSLTAGASGLGAISANASISGGMVKMKEMAVPLTDIGLKARIAGKDATVEKFSAIAGGGSVTVSGSIRDYLAAQQFSLLAEAKRLDLKEVIAQEKLPAQMEGIADVVLKLSGAGFTPDSLKQNLSGQADISLEKAKLTDINLLRLVLDRIAVIPGLSERVQAGLPERFKQKLSRKDTVLSDVQIPAVIENGRMVVKEMTLGAEEFTFIGGGSFGIDSTFVLEGSFLIPQDLSAAMVTQVSELSYLLNGENQIFIPLKLVGSAGQRLNVVVDAEYIAKRLLVEQGKKQLFKSLEKALGGGAGGQGTDSSQEGSGNQTSKDPAEDTVGGLLQDIFK